jgi:hypothetical protein
MNSISFQDLTAFVKRHKLEAELIKLAAEGLGFSYAEPVKIRRENELLFKIF